MPTVETAFSALRVEGRLLPPAFLQHIAAMDAPAQKPEDYAIPPGRTVRDEIGRYWTIAEALWKDYRQLVMTGITPSACTAGSAPTLRGVK